MWTAVHALISSRNRLNTSINEKRSFEATTSSTFGNRENQLESKSYNLLASNQQIQEIVKTYSTCLQNQRKQSSEPMMPRCTTLSIQIVGTNLFHWNGQDFVLVVDYYDRYWEIEKLYDRCSSNNKEDQECVFKNRDIRNCLKWQWSIV